MADRAEIRQRHTVGADAKQTGDKPVCVPHEPDHVLGVLRRQTAAYRVVDVVGAKIVPGAVRRLRFRRGVFVREIAHGAAVFRGRKLPRAGTDAGGVGRMERLVGNDLRRDHQHAAGRRDHADRRTGWRRGKTGMVLHVQRHVCAIYRLPQRRADSQDGRRQKYGGIRGQSGGGRERVFCPRDHGRKKLLSKRDKNRRRDAGDGSAI